MNAFPSAVVSLCHFCENHGPRAILSTQAIPRLQEDIDPIQAYIRPHQRSNLPWDKIAEMTAAAPNRVHTLSVIDCHKQCDTRNQDTDDDLAFGSWDRKVEFVDEDERCDACSSLTDSGAHIANDFQSKRSFISTEQALNDECFMVIKKALFRAMISERMDPAEEQRVAAHSPSFDGIFTEQRNQKLRNSPPDANDEGVLLFWNDEDCYTAIARTFVVKDAKSRGFRRRYMLLVTSRNREMLFENFDAIVDELSATAKLIQISARRVYKLEQTFDKSALRTARWMPQEFFKSKIVLDTTRSLSLLIRDDDVFFHLHRDFVSILQRMFMYEIATDPDIPTQLDLSNKAFQYYLGFQAYKDLKILQNQMTPENFKLLVWHITMGGQVVVKCNGAVPKKQLLYALTLLVPSKCVKFDPGAVSYVPSGTINFLGMESEAEYPEDAEDVFVFTVESRRMNLSSEIFNANVITSKVPSMIKGMKMPTIVRKYMRIFNSSTNVSLQSQFLALTNEKITQLEMFEMVSENEPPIDEELILRLFGLSDLLVYRFWIKSLAENPQISFKLTPVFEDEFEDYYVEFSIDSPMSEEVLDDDLIIEITQKLSQIKLNDSTRTIAHAINSQVTSNKLIR